MQPSTLDRQHAARARWMGIGRSAAPDAYTAALEATGAALEHDDHVVFGAEMAALDRLP